MKSGNVEDPNRISELHRHRLTGIQGGGFPRTSEPGRLEVHPDGRLRRARLGRGHLLPRGSRALRSLHWNHRPPFRQQPQREQGILHAAGIPGGLRFRQAGTVVPCSRRFSHSGQPAGIDDEDPGAADVPGEVEERRQSYRGDRVHESGRSGQPDLSSRLPLRSGLVRRPENRRCDRISEVPVGRHGAHRHSRAQDQQRRGAPVPDRRIVHALDDSGGAGGTQAA